MAPPNQNNGQGQGQGRSDTESRKRRFAGPHRGGMNRNRRGGPAASAAAFTTSSPSSTPVAGVAVAPNASDSAQPASTSSSADSFASLSRFNVHPTLLQSIHDDLKLTTMTAVQAETLPITLAGDDVLAQAKTGTGKTIAFLLPAIQRLVTSRLPANVAHSQRPISLLVISPTRELATQIAEEAKALLTRFPQFKVVTAVGGVNPRACLNRVLGHCDILVATPGRVLDHLGQSDGALQGKLQGVKTFVLDEADRLMDMGFLPDIQKIVRYLPEKAATGRQGMLFSATINPRVQQFAKLVCADGYKFVNTIPAGTLGTHERVPQNLITVPTFSDLTTAVLGALRHEMAANGKATFKAIVFAPTAAQADFYADVLAQFNDLPTVLKVHSRMSQPRRTKNTEEYRKSANGVLVATDVIARGLDFPGVTTVFQVGLPSDKEAYIHRLGRTARAGAEGRGTLILAAPEAPFAKRTLSMVQFTDTPAELTPAAHADVMRVISTKVDLEPREKVYRAWMGFYKSHLKTLNWTPTELVHQANLLASQGLGCPETPSIEKTTVGKMGLKGVQGLNIVPNAPRPPRGGR